jgi:hypothetical protein
MEFYLIVQDSTKLQTSAILVMLAESMIPAAYKEGRTRKISISTMVEFSFAFIVGKCIVTRQRPPKKLSKL